MIASGRRDKRVTLANPGQPVPDGDGGYTEGWAPLDPPVVWAHIDPATQRDLERAAAGTVITTATHLIGMAYHRGVNTETRIQYADPDHGVRTFSVSSVRDPNEDRRELLIVAEELIAPREGAAP